MMFILAISVGWAAETAYETLQFGTDYNFSGCQSYTATWNAKSDKYEWILYGFNNNNTYVNGNGTWEYVKCGSQKAAIDATIKTKTAIDKAITKVVVTVDATKNSTGSKLEVASDANFNSILQTVNATLAVGDVTYTIATPAKNCYYRLTFNQAKGKNGDTQISKVVCYYNPEGGDTPQPTTYSLTLPTGLTGGTVTATGASDLTAIPSGTNITVTATPATGYTLDYMKANGTEVQNPYTFAIAENTTITAAFAALQTYAITVTNGTANPTTAYEGQTVTLTPTIPDGKVVDWDNTTVTPSTLEINHSDYTFTMPGQAVTVTFAFKDAPVQSNIFQRITSPSDLEAGKRYLLVYETKPAVMGGIEGSGNTIHGASIESGFTIANGVLTLNANSDAKPLTLGGSSGAWTFDLDGALLNHTSGNSLNTGTSNTTWTIAFSGDNATITNATNNKRVIKYNTGSPRFACYESGQQAIQLYKEVEGTPQSSDVYIIGQVNGHDSDPWVSTEGVKMTYNSTNDNYAANIYCTGVNNGTHEGYSLFLFAKSLPYDWNTTSNLYGSGADGSYWGIGGTNESAFGDEIPLYEGSKNSYRLPAGLYTITADLDYTGHQYTTKSVKVTKRDVIMTISPNSATFETTKNVTMSSNLTEIGGKIYYTTNGNDPRDPNSGRIEYTGELTIDATTTFKAVAYVGNLYSDVVEKTYTKTPAAPVITPNGGTIYEATQVTITAESGATIYYTTDGNTPTPENGTQYTAPFTVSATTTVKARAYVGEVYSSVAEATYTYSDVTPSTGDFVLVTDASQLVAGNEYIIMTTDKDGYKLAMGDINSNNKGTWTQEFNITGNVGEAGSKVSVYSEATESNSLVNILELESTNGSWALKQQSAGKYLNISGDNTNINESDSKVNVSFTIYNNNSAKIQGRSDRQILFSDQNDVFGNYATSNAGKSGYEYVYLYTRESNAVQPPVFTPAGGIYDVTVDVTISCATTGASIYYTTDGTEPSATNGTPYTSEIIVSETTTIKAIAVKGDNSSSVVTAEYTIQKSTDIATVTLDYREPFTSGIGKFTVQNESGYSPVWSLDGNYGVKGTAYNANTNPTNNAATSRLVSPIIDMTDAVKPELTFSHQINSYFTDVTNQCQLFIRETTDGTDGTWASLPITFSDPAAAGGWTNDVVDIDLTDVNGVSYAGKKVQISFLYTNPTEGSGAGTWEIQNFVVADNSEYKMVNNIAEFLALENGEKAKFRNPVTVLYDYAQNSSGSYHEYIWVKDESGYMQFYLKPTLNSSTESTFDAKAAYYENGDIIPAGFVVVKNYYEDGKYVQAYSAEALDAGFEVATQKGLADPDHIELSTLDGMATDAATVEQYNNRYISFNKVQIVAGSGKNFTIKDENGNTIDIAGYNKYSDANSLLKDGETTAVVTLPGEGLYNVTAILQTWKNGWEVMPITFTPWEEKKVTLRELCASGVTTDGDNYYTISNNLLAVYANDNVLWLKDDTGQSIQMTKPASDEMNYPISETDNTRQDQAFYDQSNWLQVEFAAGFDAERFVKKIINGGAIKGNFTDKLNPTLTGATALTDEDIYAAGSYANNFYCMANFAAWPAGADHLYQTAAAGVSAGSNFFFMNPKPQEYATIAYAVWMGDDTFVIPAANGGQNGNDFNGAIKVAWDYNEGASARDLDNAGVGNQVYKFNAIIKKAAAANGAPRRVAGKDGQSASGYVVYPTNLTASTDGSIITVVDELQSGKAVDGVRYVNVAGQVAATPWQGVNIVVTRYTDGSTRTTKVVK